MTPEDFAPEECAKRLRLRYATGDQEALLDAVQFYLMRGDTAPDWVVTAFSAAWGVRWQCGGARTLGEAFGIERPSNWRQKRARKDVMTFIIWQRVIDEHRAGSPLGRALFEAVADQLNSEAQDPGSALAGLRFNGTDVQEAYYSVTKISEDSR